MNTKHMLFALACAVGIGTIGTGCDSGNNNSTQDMAMAVSRDLTMSTGPDIATPPADMAMPTCVDPNAQNPSHTDILNTCSTAQKIEKTPKLPGNCP